jgi:large subunit ribosomal protein L28
MVEFSTAVLWAFQKTHSGIMLRKDHPTMAKCENCGKTTTFGHNRSFSLRATNRTFRPNLQHITVIENGHRVQKLLCAKCIRTMVKSA